MTGPVAVWMPLIAFLHGVPFDEELLVAAWQDKARYVHLMREGTFGKTASKGRSPCVFFGAFGRIPEGKSAKNDVQRVRWGFGSHTALV